MGFLGLIGWSFLGGIIWAFNVETAAATLGARSGWPPLLVAIGCATGQSLAYLLLYFTGEWLTDRWSWFERQVVKARLRWGRRLERGFVGLTVPASLVGLPPMTGMAALAAGFGVPLTPMLAVALAGRLIRFYVLALLGQRALSWLT